MGHFWTQPKELVSKPTHAWVTLASDPRNLLRIRQYSQ
jgi:hypothetical protein